MSEEVTSEEFIFPKLEVMINGSSGIEIRARLTQKYNCVEFSLNDKPQPVFISPFMQWEPVEMNEERAKIAYGIVHRAAHYDTLVKEVADLQNRVKCFYKREDRFRNQVGAAFDMWKADRKKMGLPEDFSDITTWPAELMNGYINGYEG